MDKVFVKRILKLVKKLSENYERLKWENDSLKRKVKNDLRRGMRQTASERSPHNPR